MPSKRGKKTNISTGSPAVTQIQMEPSGLSEESVHSLDSGDGKFKLGSPFGITPIQSSQIASPASTTEYTPIGQINGFTSLRRICGRITFKSLLKEWKNASSQGHVFHFCIYDGTGEISFSCFDAEQFQKLKVNACVLVQNFNIKTVNPDFKKTGHNFELTSITGTTIAPVNAESVPQIPFCFKLWTDLQEVERQDTSVDMILIVTGADPVVLVGQKHTPKRTISCIDGALNKLKVHLWLELAQEFNPTEFTSLVVRNAKLNYYEGVASLNVSPDALFWPDPDLQEAQDVFHRFLSRNVK